MCLILVFIQSALSPGFYLGTGHSSYISEAGSQIFSTKIDTNKTALSAYRLYQISELNVYSLEQHIKALNAGLSFDFLDINTYQESNGSLWFNRDFIWFRIGLKYQFRRITVEADNLGLASNISLQVQSEFYDYLIGAVSINNLIKQPELFEQSVIGHLFYQQDNTSIQFELENYHRSYKTRLILSHSFDKVKINAAYQFSDEIIYGGLRLDLFDPQIYFAFSWHPELGMSHSVALAFFY